MRLHRFQRADDLELFVPHRIRFELRRRLHGDETQQLHEVVLHHVPHGARLVVIAAAPADSHGLGHGDLDVIDILRVPQRFEQHVAEADGHQVLHRLLAEVMVDPVDLRLVEMLGQHGVERLRSAQVMPEGFLDHNAALARGHAVLVQPLRQIAEKRRADGEIEGPHPVFGNAAAQFLPTIGSGSIHLNIAQPRKKRVQRPAFGHGFAAEFLDRVAHQLTVAVIVHLGPRGADDLRLFGHLAGTEAAEQTRQDLAPRQVAGAAEDDKIERIDRDDSRNHVRALL